MKHQGAEQSLFCYNVNLFKFANFNDKLFSKYQQVKPNFFTINDANSFPSKSFLNKCLKWLCFNITNYSVGPKFLFFPQYVSTYSNTTFPSLVLNNISTQSNDLL